MHSCNAYSEKNLAIGLLFIIDHYDRTHFALGCSLSYCFRVYLLRQTCFKSSIWLFLNYLFLFVWEASPLMQLEEVQKQDLYLTRAVSKDQMSLGQVFHFCTTHPSHPQKTNKIFDCQIRTQHTNPISVVKFNGFFVTYHRGKSRKKELCETGQSVGWLWLCFLVHLSSNMVTAPMICKYIGALFVFVKALTSACM